MILDYEALKFIRRRFCCSLTLTIWDILTISVLILTLVLYKSLHLSFALVTKTFKELLAWALFLPE